MAEQVILINHATFRAPYVGVAYFQEIPPIGSLLVAETADAASFAGYLTDGPIVAIEAADSCLIEGDVTGDFFSASEALDVARLIGDVLSQPVRPTPLRNDALKESITILQRVLTDLVRSVPSQNTREASELRLSAGEILAQGQLVFSYPTSTLADDLLNCFTLAVSAGATVGSMAYVRRRVMAEMPFSLLASATVQLSLCYCLSSEARLVAMVDFKSRDDVDNMLASMNVAFDEAEEFAADALDAASYRSLVELHAAVTRDLVTKSRPLPRMVSYSFTESTPALWLANRLYADATRVDELIDENHIVHPAFAPLSGRCLAN